MMESVFDLVGGLVSVDPELVDDIWQSATLSNASQREPNLIPGLWPFNLAGKSRLPPIGFGSAGARPT
jgi:hypothetical protein